MLDADLKVPSMYQLMQLASTSLPDLPIKDEESLGHGGVIDGMMVSLRTRKGSWSVVFVSWLGKDSRSTKVFGLGRYPFTESAFLWTALVILCLDRMRAVPQAIVSSRFTEISPRMVLGAIDGTMAATLIFSSSTSWILFSSRRLLWLWSPDILWIFIAESVVMRVTGQEYFFHIQIQ